MTGKRCVRPLAHRYHVGGGGCRPAGEDGAHIEDGSDRPKLERALRTRYLARTFGI